MQLFYRIRQLILVAGDLLVFIFCFWLSLAIRYFEIPSLETFEHHVAILPILLALWLVLNYINGLYDLVRCGNIKNSSRRLLETAMIALVVSMVLFYILPKINLTPKTILVLAVFIGYSLVFIWRLLYEYSIGDKGLKEKILFVGHTKEMVELVNIITKLPQKGYQICAWIDPTKSIDKEKYKSIEIYERFQTIRPLITNHHISTVVIAPDLRHQEEVLRELYELLFWDVRIMDMTSFYETITGRIPPSTFSEGWFLDHIGNNDLPVYKKIRILIDYIAALLLGIIFVILFPLIVIGIKTTSKGPIFFKQKRVGKYGKHFFLYKFRSMYSLAEDGSAEMDGAQFATKNDERATTFGRFLRKVRLDELPQFINMLKRDITLIGPRPERPEIVEKLEEKMPYYSLRHVIRPGLTSWAVLHQNYTDNIETSLQKLQYDLYYIKNRSLLLDLSILLKTVNLILRGMGQ
ncbi:MAG: hypothetical protein COX81_02050 [Candidatus Magasanikbacteria bacterium CG_4_10_14_0_2_um_filter_37_12]|uniref:Bacterial sugar transferase domain-containing protein n=1 Tax=Candidatus Magasanikbacteria bacterium CG_4_10_14_0_2_um_filter_37_12 TaxID=1974637 RepID=A0A2M7V8C9_9BACT|nr:MAG: hypothetical protein COX81_02050 [Candidatus Magasanikbacteria bacterium CG_4_10_14_0_2_um_filter_37_12]